MYEVSKTIFGLHPTDYSQNFSKTISGLHPTSSSHNFSRTIRRLHPTNSSHNFRTCRKTQYLLFFLFFFCLFEKVWVGPIWVHINCRGKRDNQLPQTYLKDSGPHISAMWGPLWGSLFLLHYMCSVNRQISVSLYYHNAWFDFKGFKV